MSDKPRNFETLIFNHIPKTGGTTLRQILSTFYPPEQIVTVNEMMEKDNLFKRLSHSTASEHRQIRLICGHFIQGVHELLQQRSTYITLLRHPLERLISHYYYQRCNPQYRMLYRKAQTMSFRDFVLGHMVRNHWDNFQTRLISGVLNADCEKDKMLQRALCNLKDHYLLAGTTELFDESILLLQQLLGWKPPFYKRDNVTSYRLRLSDIPRWYLKQIEPYYALDMELYLYVRNTLRQQLKERGLVFKKKLFFFKIQNWCFQKLNVDNAPPKNRPSSLSLMTQWKTNRHFAYKAFREKGFLYVLGRFLYYGGCAIRNRSRALVRPWIISTVQAYMQCAGIPTSKDEIYNTWLLKQYPSRWKLAQWKREIRSFAKTPTISLVMPVYNPLPSFLKIAIESVCQQIYPFWELCIADDGTNDPTVKKILEDYARRDSRIKVRFREQNGHISIASNTALRQATGTYVGFLDQDDKLAPHALLEVIRLLQDHPDPDLIYSDEDLFDSQGNHIGPFFKPPWSPEILLCSNYLNHFFVCRRTLLESMGGLRRGFEGAQDHDLALRLTGITNRIHHIPTILYHWRRHPGSTAWSGTVKPYALPRSRQAVHEALGRRKEPAQIEIDRRGLLKIYFASRLQERLSLVLPVREETITEECLACLEALKTHSDFRTWEILLVSPCKNHAMLQKLITPFVSKQQIPFRLLASNPWNGSAQWRNLAIKEATGHFLFFLDPQWRLATLQGLERLLSLAGRQPLAGVGALCIDRDHRIIHAGLTRGDRPRWHGLPVSEDRIYFWLHSLYNVASLSGSCLLVERKKLVSVGAFDETLPDELSVTDMMFRMLEAGYRHVVEPNVQFVTDHSIEEIPTPTLPDKDHGPFKKKWQRYLTKDPYWSPHLTPSGEIIKR